MPGSTPSRTTPRKAAIDTANSVRRCCQSRDRAGDVGKRQRRGDHDGREGRLRQVPQQSRHEHEHQHDRERSDQPGDLRLRTGLLGDGRPRAARADGEALEEARPRCSRRRSRSSPGCRRSPGRSASANADAVAIVSASVTSAMPSAPPSRSARSESRTRGTVKGGKPCGSVPTSFTPCSLELEDARRDDRQDDGHEHAGDLGQRRAAGRRSSRGRQADRERRRSPSRRRRHPSRTPSPRR